MKKECSENEVRNKAEAYCSSVERCVSEVEAKLEQWGADNGIKERVIEHLIKEKYIDQQRYCAAFVRDKYRFNQVGTDENSAGFTLEENSGKCDKSRFGSN